MTPFGIALVCYRVGRDPAFRALVLADPRGALEGLPLDDDETRALLDGDVATLHATGVHAILLNRLQRYGAFGLDADTSPASK
jgi:hypothetical protein